MPVFGREFPQKNDFNSVLVNAAWKVKKKKLKCWLRWK
jgi:hypothetical protein